jgi:hypothetical protein
VTYSAESRNGRGALKRRRANSGDCTSDQQHSRRGVSERKRIHGTPSMISALIVLGLLTLLVASDVPES